MTAGVPFPSNPYRGHVCVGDDCEGCSCESSWGEGFSAAGSWWRSRLVSDETVEAVARVIAGRGSWPYQHHYAKARAALASLIPVAEKPETDTSPEPIPDSEFVEPPLMPPDPISERMIDIADDAFRHGSSDEQAWRECLGDALHAVYPLIRERVIAEASQGKRPANPEPEADT